MTPLFPTGLVVETTLKRKSQCSATRSFKGKSCNDNVRKYLEGDQLYSNENEPFGLFFTLFDCHIRRGRLVFVIEYTLKEERPVSSYLEQDLQ